MAHLITSLDQNGAQFALARLAHALASPHFSHLVISIAPIRTEASVSFPQEVPVFSLNISPRLPNPLGYLRLVAKLRAFRPDIFQTWLYHADALGSLAKPLVDAPLVWNIRCSDMASDYAGPGKRLLLAFLKSVSRTPELVVANSQQGISHHESIGYRSRRWIYVPNGFDLTEFRPNEAQRSDARQTLGLKPNDLAVGIAARFHEMKDYPTFLRAANLTLAKFGQARFVVFGDGNPDEVAAVRGLSKDLGIEGRMIWAGHWDTMPKAYNSLDILVMSSSYGEGFPNSVGEAMACGVPAVVTDVGDAGTLVADINRVVPPSNPEALAEAISKVLSLPADGRIALGERDRNRIASHFSDSLVAARYRDIYRDLVAANR